MIDYRNLGEGDFAQVLTTVTHRLSQYGIAVRYTSDLPPHAVAQFDGPTIVLAAKISPDVALFTLLHVFGHTVQYSIDPANQLEDDASIETHRKSEYEASRYGLTLLHELGETRLDQWVSDVWHWDWAYMERIRAGTETSQPTFSFDYTQIPPGQPTLTTKPIPPFQLQQFATKTVI